MEQEEFNFVQGKEADPEFNYNIDTTIINKEPFEEASLFSAITRMNEIMFDHGALYVFLRLNKQHQKDIMESFFALANGNE